MGLGDWLSGILGTNSQYQASSQQAGNPYSLSTLQQEANNQSQIYAQQQALGQQLQAQAAGQGPNPAQIQFGQNTANNIANAQGLISSQRGINPALATRMGANAAAGANQQAAGQSALLQAQQQIAAQQQLAGLYGQQQQGNIAQQGLYTGVNQGAAQTNAAVANANQQQAGNLVGGILGGASLGVMNFGKSGAGAAAAPSAAAAAHGGEIQSFDEGGQVNSNSLSGFFQNNFSQMGNQNNNSSYLNQGFGPLGAMNGGQNFNKAFNQAGAAAGEGLYNAFNPINTDQLQNNINTISPNSPIGQQGNGSQIDTGMGKANGGAINFKPGGRVPGQASVPGDSLKNDTVPAMVSPGEIVIPRSVAQSDDAVNKSAKFVAAVLARHGMRKK